MAVRVGGLRQLLLRVRVRVRRLEGLVAWVVVDAGLLGHGVVDGVDPGLVGHFLDDRLQAMLQLLLVEAQASAGRDSPVARLRSAAAEGASAARPDVDSCERAPRRLPDPSDQDSRHSWQ